MIARSALRSFYVSFTKLRPAERGLGHWKSQAAKAVAAGPWPFAKIRNISLQAIQ
jgi:hypothetical protein